MNEPSQTPSKSGFFRRKEPRGISKEDAEREQNRPRGIAFFFILLGRNFSKLLSLNLLMLFQILPLAAALYIYIQGPTTPAMMHPLFPTLYGVSLLTDSPAVSLMQTLFGTKLYLPVYHSPALLGAILLLLLLALTWGWQNVGATHILRSLVRGDPAFLWTDYRYAIRRNRRQAFWVGLMDAGILALLGFDILYFSGMPGSFFTDLLFFCTIGMAIVYLFMRYYLYLMLITFDLSVKKLLKNALIFTVLGIKRNLAATIGVVLMAVLNLLLIVLFSPIGVVVPAILPFFYFPAFSAFMTAYGAYPNIKKYMIDPQMPAA